MKTWKLLTILALTLTIAGVAVASAYAFCWWSTPTSYTNGITTPTTTLPTPQTTNTPPTLYTPQTTQAYTDGYGYGGRGWGGCRGNWGYGYGTATNTATTPLTIEEATQIAQTYVASLNNPDLAVTHVEQYTANFYVEVGEKSTGYGAFELLINPSTGVVTAEPGPNMMWNTRYSFNGGFCNWLGTATATGQPTVAVEQAQVNAQLYLDAYLPGTTTGDVTAFYGYYTLEVLNGGAPYGMLSVNAYTGQVWYHTWHGVFVEEATIA